MIIEKAIILGGLIIGTITDLKTREVPDWLNYFLIAFGIISGATKAIILRDASMITSSIAGLIIGTIIGTTMFYTGQWGGGDAKMMMGIGAIMGMPIKSLKEPLTIINTELISFIINIIIIGAIYGIIWAIIITIKNKERFKKEIKKIYEKKENKKARRATQITSIILTITGIIIINKNQILGLSITVLGLTAYALLILMFWAKAVEKSCMIKKIPVKKLTEGDWIIGEIKHKGKIIASEKDLGITKEQIEELKKARIKEVTIKEGIPFIPSFLIAYLLMLITSNLIITILRYAI